MLEKFDMASFKAKDGRVLIGRVTSVGDRLATIKAIGLGTVHRVAHGHVARLIMPPTIADATALNLNAKEAADKRKAVDKMMRAERKRKLAQFEAEGFPDRYAIASRTTH